MNNIQENHKKDLTTLKKLAMKPLLLDGGDGVKFNAVLDIIVEMPLKRFYTSTNTKKSKYMYTISHFHD